jgi:uncharacterized RDD family membrane protein YckC
VPRVLAYLVDVSLFAVPTAVAVWASADEAVRRALVRLVTAKAVELDAFGVTAGEVLAGNVPGRLAAFTFLVAGGVAGWVWYRVVTVARGVSVGKRLFKLRVVDAESHTPVGTRRAWRRWAPNQALGLLPIPGTGFVCYLAALWSPQRRGWHDKAAGTVVVRVQP